MTQPDERGVLTMTLRPDELGEPPEQWVICEGCDGYGDEACGIWVYEPGCAFGHESTEERPCRECGGAGGWIRECRANDEQTQDD